ncbi:hypothetical protein S83_051376, partial [Arachis hypogaea]
LVWEGLGLGGGTDVRNWGSLVYLDILMPPFIEKWFYYSQLNDMVSAAFYNDLFLILKKISKVKEAISIANNACWAIGELAVKMNITRFLSTRKVQQL